MTLQMASLVDKLDRSVDRFLDGYNKNLACLYARYGLKLGKHWARYIAEPQELERLAKWYTKRKNPNGDGLYLDYESEPPHLIHSVIRPAESGWRDSVKFWKSLLGKEYGYQTTESPGFLPAFVNGAVDVWLKKELKS